MKELRENKNLMGDDNNGFGTSVLNASLEYMNFFNSGDLIRNLAPGKPDARVIGKPTVGNGVARFRGSAGCLETQVPDLPAATLIAKVLFEQSPELSFAIANYSINQIGALLFLDKAAGVNVYRGRFQGGKQVPEGSGMLIPDWKTPILVVGRYDGRRSRIDNLTTKETVENASKLPIALADGFFRIGGSNTPATSALTISYASIHSRWISDEEMYALATEIDKYSG